MKALAEIEGAVFDVDGTLLAVQAEDVRIGGLHDHSRLLAIRQVAEKYDLADLQSLTPEENTNAFFNAKFSSLDGAVWSALHAKGVVVSEDLDPYHDLLLEIVALKNEIHVEVMRKHGRAVVGAVELVHRIASVCGPDKLAIASSAIRRDIDILIDETEPSLRQYFPPERIISHDDIEHGFGKPDPRPFDLAFRQLGLSDSKRGNVLAVEDDPRGVKSAKGAELSVLAITTTFSRAELEEAGADLIVDHYHEVYKQFEK